MARHNKTQWETRPFMLPGGRGESGGVPGGPGLSAISPSSPRGPTRNPRQTKRLLKTVQDGPEWQNDRSETQEMAPSQPKRLPKRSKM
eukprot:3703476-Pyramimonas_sp.AAC.1